MTQRYEIRLGGSGGQGLVLAGVILGEACVIYDKKNAIQSQSYGPEARGGMSKSDIVISDSEIDYPKATKIDLLLTLTDQSFNGYIGDLVDGGICIYDKDRIKEVKAGNYKLVGLPIFSTAVKITGSTVTANIVSLGAIVALTKIVTREAIEKAVVARAPKDTEEMNLKALKAGFDLISGGQL